MIPLLWEWAGGLVGGVVKAASKEGSVRMSIEELPREPAPRRLPPARHREDPRRARCRAELRCAGVL